MVKRISTETKFRKLLYWLRNKFPTRYKVTVRRVRRPPGGEKEECGSCSLARRHFNISVDRNQAWAQQEDSLMHEWAHALTWFGNDKEDHGPEWGLMYSKIYSAWLDWDYGRVGSEREL